MTETLAVYGGSFDPPHAGHLLCAAWIVTTQPVDRLLFVPTFRHAFGKEARASFEHRLAMCRIVAGLVPRCDISDVERGLGEPSRTFDMLTALATLHPGAQLRLVVGADIASETHRWYRWDAVEALAPPLWVGRTGHARPAGAMVDLPEVSSTDVRRRLATGASVDGLVARDVLAYLRAQQLYEGAPT